MWPRLSEPDFRIDGIVPGPAGVGADRRPLRVAWVGDSTVAGEGATELARTLPHAVAARLAAAIGAPVQVVARAESGATVAEVTRDLVPQLAGVEADVVFVSAGGNDSSHLHSRGRFVRRYAELLAALPADVPLVLLGVPDMGAAIPAPIQPVRALSEWRGVRLDAAVRRLAAEAGPRVTYVNIAGRTGRRFRRQRDQLFAADCYHPGDAGYALWAAAVVDRLAETGALARLAERAQVADRGGKLGHH
jgi:lysophospholipase L1-like esterase